MGMGDVVVVRGSFNTVRGGLMRGSFCAREEGGKGSF
jgi:hypothetical protein